ncbi:MAG: gamma-glutamyltransferase [Myxococcota bacterium]|nr:gamma-glutamyltransferase [Myxococcota bacterium]
MDGSRRRHRLAVTGTCAALTTITLASTAVARIDPPGPDTFVRYVVVTDHPLASEAGARLLRAGGNAADAAAAAMLALGVVSPASSGLGGGGFALYYRTRDRSITFLDFRERAPAAATPSLFEGLPPERSRLGGLATAVPGEVAGIDALLDRFGTRRWAEVVVPAIRLAERGVPPSDDLVQRAAPLLPILARNPLMRSWLGPDGRLDGADRLRNRDLARTLHALGRHGAGAFYRGPIARRIVSAVRGAGGVLTLDDLAAYRAVERRPLEGSRLGWRWVTAPPPSAGGWTLLASLALVERWIDPTRRRDFGPEHLHAFAEAWKGPFLDRARHFGDPDHISIPLDRLDAETRHAARAARFEPERARPASDYDVPVESQNGATTTAVPTGAGTSHLCVVDAEGNVAAVTTTINLPFGAGYSAAGIVLNNQMDDFASAVGRANAFGLPGGANNLPGPGRRPVSTMTPTLVLDDQGPILCIGASGGSRIVTAVMQVAWHVLVRGLTPRDALALPRVHHQGLPEVLYTEISHPLEPNVEAALRARGHRLEPSTSRADVQLVRLRATPNGALLAASDPRKGGRPAGR